MKGRIKRFVVTEKTLRLAEKENKIAIVVDRWMTKKDIKDLVEELYGVKVIKVNTIITPYGEKKAYVKLSEEQNAMDLLGRLGVI